MGRIILDVDQELAAKWKNSTKEQQARLTSLFRDALELITPNPTHIIPNEPITGYVRPHKKKLKAMDFVEKWAGFLTDDATDQSKYDYLSNKYD